MSKRYDSPEAFRQALQARLRTVAAERDLSVQDVQIKFLIERLLARLFHLDDPPWVLKGGFAMELRYRPHARTTKDVDLTIRTPDERDLAARLDAIREQLQEAAELDLGDHLEFRVASAKKQLPGAPQGGGRFPVDALLVGKAFGRFHIDVGFGDPVQGEPDVLTGDDMLAFAGIGPARALAVPKAQQFAEKLHAYTYVWDDRENTRVKDLVDMVMLIERGDLEVAQVRSAVDETFARRHTHGLPDQLQQPPTAWAAEFPTMAKQAGIPTTVIAEAFEVLVRFAAELGIGRSSR
jgi:hypothetical protein